ncbi:uncharacterized protein SAPINGB_P004398 [Magnusiomyces paraingens]|uniref:Uncharacterized protein n=1 Tax=Magnusiomyces paraingens TaxID=2606893 RepID=A0A5E8C1P3_9ASCO|nr:uncharacterized protein SAPINGB_P004398 [Saprochaete ingens]VVT55045.1 unnamed protein product [Saprochaete ingens]
MSSQPVRPEGSNSKPGKAQKKKQQTKSVPHRDQYQRLSFLYQAAAHMAGDPSTQALARVYAQSMKAVAKKSVLRLSPNVKRTVCKKCHRFLAENSGSVTTRIVNESTANDPRCDVLEKTCVCGVTRRFPVGQNRKYRLWADSARVS